MEEAGEPAAGSAIGPYRLERVLGRGGMGAVCLAEDLKLRRRVALKVVAAHLAEDAAFRARFLRESKVAASLDHSNVIPVYAAGEAVGRLFLAMRYVEGPSANYLCPCSSASPCGCPTVSPAYSAPTQSSWSTPRARRDRPLVHERLHDLPRQGCLQPRTRRQATRPRAVRTLAYNDDNPILRELVGDFPHVELLKA